MKKFTLVASLLLTAMTTFADSKFGNWTLNGEETKIDGAAYFMSYYNGVYQQCMENTTVATTDGCCVVTGYGAAGWSMNATINKIGTTSWSKSIEGVHIVSAVADNAGGVYVTGNFKSSVTIGDKTLTGYTKDGSNECSAFVAHYDKDGKVLAANAIVPTINEEVAAKYQNYGQQDHSVYCNAVKVIFDGTTPYVALTFTDKLSSADGTKTNISGNYAYEYYGSQFACSTQSMTVAKLDVETLGVNDFVLTVKGNDFSDASNYGCAVNSSVASIADGHLYVASTFKGNGSANGNIQVGQSDLVKLSIPLNDGGCKAIVLADVNLSDLSLNYNLYTGSYSWSADGNGENTVSDIFASGDDLIVTGTTTSSSLFDNKKVAEGNTDVFVASVKKSGFTSNWSTLSGFAEGDDNVERVSSAVVSNGKIYVGAFSANEPNSSIYKLLTSNLYAINLANGTLENIDVTDYVTSFAVDKDGKIGVSSYTNETNALNFGLYTSTATGISSVKADKIQNTKIYNLQGQRLSAPVKGQINIVNGKKVMF